jgi:hypothetical protein
LGATNKWPILQPCSSPFIRGLRNKRKGVRSARSAMTLLLVIPTVNRNPGQVTRVLG